MSFRSISAQIEEEANFTEKEAHSATKTVCSNSIDAQDARGLLDMLGLTERITESQESA